jgi:hypothetical protein
MERIFRGVAGIVGALAIIFAIRFWFAPVTAGGTLGLAAPGMLGLASLRADLGGFFAAAGLLSVAGAVRNDRRLLTAPVLLIGLALLGRVVSILHDGLVAADVLPMAVEAVLVTLLGLSRLFLADGFSVRHALDS